MLLGLARFTNACIGYFHHSNLNGVSSLYWLLISSKPSQNLIRILRNLYILNLGHSF
jgi:hypothetical protein